MTPRHTKQVIITATVAVMGIGLLVCWFGGDPFDWSKQSSKTRWEILGRLLVAAVVAFGCHWFIRRWLVACMSCTVIFTALFSSSAGLFWFIALLTNALTGFVLAAVVGTIFTAFRRDAGIQ